MWLVYTFWIIEWRSNDYDKKYLLTGLCQLNVHVIRTYILSLLIVGMGFCWQIDLKRSTTTILSNCVRLNAVRLSFSCVIIWFTLYFVINCFYWQCVTWVWCFFLMNLPFPQYSYVDSLITLMIRKVIDDVYETRYKTA